MWTQLSDLITLRRAQDTEVAEAPAPSAQEARKKADEEAVSDHLKSLIRVDTAFFAHRFEKESYNLNSTPKPAGDLLRRPLSLHFHRFTICPFVCIAAPSAQELQLYLNQFLWVLRRCSAAGENATVRRLLAADPKWINFLLSGAGLNLVLTGVCSLSPFALLHWLSTRCYLCAECGIAHATCN